MFLKAGFFNLGTPCAKPLGCLEAAPKDARKSEDIRDSLIVLPEGFNCKDYRAKNTCDTGKGILDDLANISNDFSVAFVAGLITADDEAVSRRYSSPYLIVGDKHPILICQKTGDDSSGNYTPCDQDYDVENPCDQNDYSIGALIRMDANGGSRQRTIEPKLENSHASQKILCIPACMDHQYRLEQFIQDSKEKFLIISNRDPSGCESAVLKNCSVLASCAPEEKTKSFVRIVELE